MVGATGLAVRFRGQFVVETIYRRYGVSGFGPGTQPSVTETCRDHE
jgi:hypothetical protein